MRLKRASQRRRPVADINVVPYIDVMLVLLVIFMITAPLLSQGIHVNLPHAQAKALSAKDRRPVVVSVNRDGQYFLNLAANPRQALPPQALMTQVAAYLTLAQQHHESRPVYVKGDKDVHYGQVVHAMVLLQKAGAEHVGLITQP